MSYGSSSETYYPPSWTSPGNPMSISTKPDSLSLHTHTHAHPPPRSLFASDNSLLPGSAFSRITSPPSECARQGSEEGRGRRGEGRGKGEARQTYRVKCFLFLAEQANIGLGRNNKGHATRQYVFYAFAMLTIKGDREHTPQRQSTNTS